MSGGAQISTLLEKKGDEQKNDSGKLLLGPSCAFLPAALVSRLEERNPEAAKARAKRAKEQGSTTSD